MHRRVMPAVLAGLLLCLSAPGCTRSKPHAPAAPQPPVPPMSGWKIGLLRKENNTIRETFIPEHREGGHERMWVVITDDPTQPLLKTSVNDTVETFRLPAGCQQRDLNLIRKNEDDILFEDKGAKCYKHAFRTTIGRIARSNDTVSFIAYRVDLEKLPDDKRDAIIKYLNAAPLRTKTQQK
jgi:hypothetical protein